MKLLMVVLGITSVISISHADEGNFDAAADAVGYGYHVAKENVGDLGNGVQDAGHAVANSESVRSTWGFLSDVGNGVQEKMAMATGDGLSINASVYAMALRQAERDNTPLTTLKNAEEERLYRLQRTEKETERLKDISKEYKEDATQFKKNISSALEDVAKTAKNLEGWDKAHQEKLDNLLAEQKKAQAASPNGDSGVKESQTLSSLTEAWVDLESFIKKSPDSAKKLGLDTRVAGMKSLLEGATTRVKEKEKQIIASTALINELSKVDDKQKDSTENMQRQMILGTLNNSVNNLINQAEFSSNRSSLAFVHFGELENELAAKGVRPGDVKKQYKKNINALSAKYNDTPIGVYVNSQIAKAMSSVCDLVNNQCNNGTNASLFDFLDNSSRINFKAPSQDLNSSDKKSGGIDAISK